MRFFGLPPKNHGAERPIWVKIRAENHMTTLVQENHTCLVCGETSEFVEIGSTNQVGAYDLDSRPPEMLRSTIPYWIQRCPHCGYCAPQVWVGPESAGEIIQSDAYLGQLSDRFYPALADHFLCWAMIQEACGELVEAGWACVNAAWACDDEGATIGASLCRLKAVGLLKQARKNHVHLFEQPGADDALLADLYRRSGEFEKAVTAVQVGVLKRPVETIRQMLYYQVALVMKRDIACHTIEEAVQHAAASATPTAGKAGA